MAHLLISGNKNNRGFNEPVEMEKRILAENVPVTAIELDFGGTGTWELSAGQKKCITSKKSSLLLMPFMRHVRFSCADILALMQ